MPTVTVEKLAQVHELLQAGKVQEADDLLKQHSADAEAESIRAGEPAPPPPPRTPAEITHELFAWIVMHLGNHPRALELLHELEAAFAKL